MAMKELTFIWHDCFVYNDDKNIVVFDYWRDPASRNQDMPRFIEEASKNKNLIVFVSHHHKDHYNPCIFQWEKLFSKTTFIVSQDVRKYSRHLFKEDSIYNGYKPDIDNVYVMKPNEILKFNDFEVKSFGSTDIGNSYLIEIDGLGIFHAGDLNAWMWKDESSQEEIDEAIGKYMKILWEIKKANPQIDLAMFPVDSRIGTDYFEGAYRFVREIYVRYFFPMHFCLGDTKEERCRHREDACRIYDYANPEHGEYICLTSPYSRFGF